MAAISPSAALEDALKLLGTQIIGLPDAIATAQARLAQLPADEGRVSLFDRPQPVIVMGPRPLPVTGTGGSEKPKREPKEQEPKQKAGLLSQGFDMLIGRFAAVLGPIALFGAVASSATSGLGTLVKSVQLFAATLTPILLPASVLLATAFTALAEVITAGTGAGMESFFGIVLAMGIPALVALIDSALKLAEAFDELGKSKGAKAVDKAEQVAETKAFKLLTTGGMNAGLEKLLPLALGTGAGAIFDEDSERTPGEAKPPTRGENIVMGGLRDVMTSMRMSVMPKASISSIEGIGKSVQLAALNQDPIEGRMLRTQEMILRALERAVNRMGRERAVYGPGAGEYDEDKGGSISISDGSADYGG